MSLQTLFVKNFRYVTWRKRGGGYPALVVTNVKLKCKLLNYWHSFESHSQFYKKPIIRKKKNNVINNFFQVWQVEMIWTCGVVSHFTKLSFEIVVLCCMEENHTCLSSQLSSYQNNVIQVWGNSTAPHSHSMRCKQKQPVAFGQPASSKLSDRTATCDLKFIIYI